MQAYVSLNVPGYSSNSLTLQEPKGFGKYEVSYSLQNLLLKTTNDILLISQKEN